MNKEQKLNRIAECHGNLARIIQEFIQEDKFTDKDPLEDALLRLARQYESQIIIDKNEAIAKALTYFVNNGIWENINQIIKSLPDDLISSLRHEKEGVIKDIIGTFANQLKEFMDLSQLDRKMALDFVRNQNEGRNHE